MRWREERGPGRGLQLHIRRVVDPPAPPVLLLHGLGVGGSVFQAFARRLLPHLAAVAPDLRGHGQSDAPAFGYLPADYALDLVELIMDRLDWPLPVVGHSLGALVSLELGHLRPELVSWLVLLDPPLDPDHPSPDIECVYRLRSAPAGELEAYLLQQNPRGGELLADSLARLFRQASDAAFEAFLDGPAFQPTQVDQPTLIVQADPRRGGVLSDEAAQRFVTRLPRGKLVKLHGAPHALHASHPAEVAQAILKFAQLDA
jgi:pimeloyl-ACP methyl ester carboxylesterase